MENKKQHKLGKRLKAAGITAGILVAVLLLNIGFTLLTNTFLLRIDMTAEKFNEISDQSIKLLDELDPEENNFSIYFLAEEDELRSPALGYSSSYYTQMGYEAPVDLWGMKYVYDLALEFAERYDFIKVETLNMRRDAALIEQFKTTLGTELTAKDVIIDNYTSEKDANGNLITDENGDPIMHHNFLIFGRDRFFAFNTDTYYAYAFNGDERFTSTFLSLAGANPTVYFVSGHGEKIGDYSAGEPSATDNYGEAQALRDLFFDAGFSTRKIDLASEYETLFNDPTARIVVLYGPESDFSGSDAYQSGSVSEIDILRKFLINPAHHMMVFMDQTEQELSNLEEYLYDFWGISFGDDLVKDNGANSLSEDGLTFIGEYETDKKSVGINLVNSLTSLDSQPIVGFSNARPIIINPEYNQSTSFFEGFSTMYAGAVFYAPDSASSGAVEAQDEGASKTDDAVPSEVLAALTYENFRDTDNNEHNTYVFSCGTSGFASEAMLEDTTYGNRDVLFYAMRLMGKETVLFEIDYKVIQSEGLDKITEGQATAWTVVLSAMLPVTVLVVGTVTFVKRRHS